MDKALPFISLILFSVLVGSCKKENFLGKTKSTDLDENTVFADSAYTMNFLNGIYSDIGFSVAPNRFKIKNASGFYLNGGGLDAASDEAEGALSGAVNTYIQFATGTVNPAIITDDAWRISYTNIRRANIFLKHRPHADLSDKLKTRTKAEARFLRAWYYFILLEHYGGVPLMGDSVYNAADDIPQVRNTFAECVNYIVSECDIAAADLDSVQVAENYGRVNKTACKSLKSRLLLYAASPLFNGGQIAESPELRAITGYPSADANRWKLAEDAALEVMKMGYYGLLVDNTTEPGYGFYQVFTLRKSPELIFARMQGPNRELEGLWQPPTRGVSNPAAYPYQDLAEAFGMANGRSITDPTSGYDASHPYNNRDPRFNNTFIHDQTLVIRRPELTKFPVNIHIDATDPSRVSSGQDAIYKGTPTGLYTNKMLNRDVVSDWFNTNTNRCFPLIRYAEILLNFAEARNERLAAPDAEVYSAVEEIRKRAGLNPYTLPTGLSKAGMRTVIQNERRLELAFEGHRFFDVRRWKIAETTENQQMHGTEPTKTATGTTYRTINVRKHTFDKRMYLWPIPLSEVSKSTQLLQNPGY
ncbi:putative outer membrane starch-binding protein [Arcticibacter tournemirensis]|uniref:RagB/SusD family nutrient uptake outer membrane protein n=1 Tax=Arcticibacter tournemirensis TaxID=699437 RepID=A0A5M9GWW4_9SPHI|nr:RagB/SusD family nutrient uptake outer membrane protein [Arcticibacter tournemirensis]KAA8479106.1 RagB/SusD family nutrient uptake outer membrane protein [Arcticibacter tournemirensis]TQM48640.1 putative outer membrane starch-binding protein [Arcticibacter tournemirensis]